jgi:hypothetical protein
MHVWEVGMPEFAPFGTSAASFARVQGFGDGDWPEGKWNARASIIALMFSSADQTLRSWLR